MLVYDITNEKSFDNIRNWIRNIEEVREFSPPKFDHWLGSVNVSCKLNIGRWCLKVEKVRLYPSPVACFS